MPRRAIHWLVASVLIAFASQVSGVACAEKRVALVIGNNAYQHAPRLPNPVNDASDMRSKLNALGFQIFGGADLDRAEMVSALAGFWRAVENSDVALVFYAGHGLQVSGQNYLVPIDANVEFEAELNSALVPFSVVMQHLARGSRVNIVLLDACHDNPFSQSLSRTMGSRAVGAIGRGLSRVNSAAGTFIAYATAPDRIALDGIGRNSPFTSALLKFIDRPGLSLSDMMIEVRKDVVQSTSSMQVPWTTSSLTAPFTFRVEGAVTPSPQGSQTNEAEALIAEYNKLYQQGRYSEAIPLAQRLLAIGERSLSPDHPDVATSLSRLAVLYNSQGRYADAELLHKRALAIREKSLGPDHRTVATSLNNLALVYKDQGRYTDAEPLYKRALAIYEKSLGPGHPDVALSLDNLASLYLSEGRYVDAEPLFKRALAIREKSLGPDHPDVAISLNNLAVLYNTLGRYAEAEPLFKRALSIDEKSLGPDHPEFATALNNLALLYRDLGRDAEAEPLYKRSLAIWEKSLGPNHRNVASSLNNLALLYDKQGRYADAEPLYKRSLAIFEKSLGTDHPDVGQLLNNLAAVYYAQSRYADAEQFYKRALAVYEKSLGPDHPRVGQSLQNLALLYRKQGRSAAASEPLYQRSLAIWEKSYGSDHPEIANVLGNLAALYKDLKRYAEAEPLYKRSLAIWEKSLGPDHPLVALALNNFAVLYYAQRRYADALPLVHRTIAQGVGERTVAFPVLFQSQRQNLVSAAGAFDDSYNTEQRATSSAAANAVSKLAARFAAGAGPLAELVRQDQDLTAEDERLDKNLIAALSKLPAERNAATEDQIRNRIEAIKSERAKLQEIFNQRFPDYVALSKPKPLSLIQTQALLADDEALVVLDFDATSYAWVITRADADWVELQVSSKDLDSQVKALRQSLTFGGDKPFDPQLAFKIYRETFGPFADRIAAKKRLSVVTNGALTSLPPALLVTKDPGGKGLKDVDWLIRSHAITILPSVSSLKILRSASATPSAAKPMIAFGDPVFSRVAHAQAQRQVAMRSITTFYSGTQIDVASLRERLPQLPGTRTEVQAIARALHSDAGDIKLGLAVTETAVKQAKLDQYRIAYFATHGLVAGELEQFTKSKAEPALALTIPDNVTDFDDGLLSASEIAQLKLNADWVVLSACNTAAEDKPGAEALSGLARAFFYAGARSLIVSHWEVDDEATARLMTGTFQAIARDTKLSHGEALRLSMLTLIDNAKSDDDANPRLWAPFVVVGEPAKSQ